MIDKEFLEDCLNKGLSTREIEKLPGVTIKRSTISWYIHRFGLIDKMKYKKPEYNEDFFSKIDTKEKAYILGYTIADAYIGPNDIDYRCCLGDREILDFIQSNVGGTVRISTKIDRIKRRFPNASISIGNAKIVRDLNNICGGKKIDRKLPIIDESLNRFLLLGLLDADGSISFGKKKKTGQDWKHIEFTSSESICFGIKDILTKTSIEYSMKKRSNEDCFDVRLSSKNNNILRFLDFIYPDESFIVLKRKYEKAKALRHILGECGEDII